MSVRKHIEYVGKTVQVSGWIPDYRKWDQEDFSSKRQLGVFFMNKCPTNWEYNGEQITFSLILDIANGAAAWNKCFREEKDRDASQIRVHCYGKWYIAHQPYTQGPL